MTIEQIPSPPFKQNVQSVVSTTEDYVANREIDVVDTSTATGTVTISLPAQPVYGDLLKIVTGDFSVTVDGNGHDISGAGEGGTIDIGTGQSRDFTFSAANRWVTNCCVALSW